MATFAFRTMTDKRFHVTLLLGLAAFAGAAAGAESGGNLPILLAGEIILAPPKGDASPSSTEASRQRESAREHRKGQSAPAPALIIVPEDDEGVLSPRRSSSSNGAAENAARARAQRQGENGAGSAAPVLVLPETPAPAAESPAAQRAHSNRARAIEYRKGEQHSQAVVKGSDSLPVIDCSTVDNIAGRIGDDTRSGSVVILIQDRNQVKVRCR